MAVGAGTITHAGTAGAYGQKVDVTRADGTVTTYSHLSRIDVSLGRVVSKGTRIGSVGTTGNVIGPHLHFEVRHNGGAPIDPRAAMAALGVNL